MSIDTGGPAFPTTKPLDSWGDPNQGMTLRDYFAAKAMAAIIQSGKWGPQTADVLHYDDDQNNINRVAGCLAEGAYQMAEAMLRAR